VLATRLHHDDEVASVLEMTTSKDTTWTAVPEARCFCAEITHHNRRFVGVFSPVRYFRDRARHAILCAKVEDGLIALEARVRAGRLSDPAKIGAAADPICVTQEWVAVLGPRCERTCSPATSTRRPGVMTKSSSAGAM
jgi:hypothetical protein